MATKEIKKYDSGGASQNLQKCRMCPWLSTDTGTRLRELQRRVQDQGPGYIEDVVHIAIDGWEDQD